MATTFGTTTGAPLELPQWNGEVFNFEDVNAAFKAINEHAKNTDAAIAIRALKAAELIANRIYMGVDLTVVFAKEIAAAPFNGDPWAWIKARAQAGNFTGINIGDYIPFTAGGHSFKAEIAGMDTYYRYGDIMVSHHIDFICRELWPDLHVYNKVNYNNGTSVNASPWLASDLYAYLNSLQMNVPNSAAANPALVAVDYRATGVYDKLPQKLKDVIVEKRLLLPSRYAAGQLLVDDNSWAWQNAGKLWIPAEVEVYGHTVWGTVASTLQGFGQGGYQQYPIFACNMKRVKFAAGADETAGNRSHWWLSTAHGGYSTLCAFVTHGGDAGGIYASNGGIRAPLCFRVA